MGKAAKGAGKAAAKAAKKAKQEKLAERRAAKQVKGGKKNTLDSCNEEDLDALLEQYRTQWEEAHASAEETVGTLPSRRANATYVAWKLMKLDAMPPSAHQMVAMPAGGGQLWCFGGEFASTKQTSFHHYRDLWVYSIADRLWEKVETKVRPSGRSGHRMAVWKHFLVLFGGFIDTGVRTSYLQDLWLFDTLNYKWHEVKQNDLRRPGARSGFSFLPSPEGIVLYGGYCKKFIKGQRTQGIALEDAWLLQMDEDISKIQWVKRRKIGYAPNPPRSGCTMALWSNRSTGVLFGGVTDTEQDEESMESTFHNALYGYQLPGNGRWISLNLRKPKKRAQPNGGQGDEEDEDPRYKMPLERYNAMLAVQRNTLYIFGGIFEKDDREYTLDDFYTIDLSKMNQVNCLRECPIDALEWHSSDDDDDSDDSDDDSNDERGDDEQNRPDTHEPEGEEMEIESEDELLVGEDLDMDSLSIEEAQAALEQQAALRKQANAFMGVMKDTNRSEEDVLSTPAPGEVLQTFYLRTKHYWAALAHTQTEGSSRGKQLRRDGFDLAEKRFMEYKPLLDEIERIRNEAQGDIDEAVGGMRRPPTGSGVESRHRR
ncbi:Kelch repeat-containing protein 3 [Malassezia yamatoensis]|uniref:Kelch repeat-containing protein 3 n=1 Tax=Malassezia yamatoensis TaxID=253288 RepID=A0AAJ5YSG5_9BASI|nr:Kelch repeat-containing protein 3 [Malassezia yamatoensis]